MHAEQNTLRISNTSAVAQGTWVNYESRTYHQFFLSVGVVLVPDPQPAQLSRQAAHLVLQLLQPPVNTLQALDLLGDGFHSVLQLGDQPEHRKY